MKKVSFIHCADLHLDSPFKGLTYIPSDRLEDIRQSTFHVLANLTKAAIEHKVDFVLMVGDIFDQAEQSMQAHMALRQAFTKLQAHDIPVYMSFANHDFLQGQSFPHHYPENVYWFDSEQVQALPFYKEGELLAQIYGFSYEQRAIYIDKSKEYKKTSDSCLHIATLHGSKGKTEHAAYAPFQLQGLREMGFDYWALGHIHKREILSTNPVIAYPGNMQGRSIKETGEKGCYLVTLSEHDTDLHFLPLAPIIFEKRQISLKEYHQLDWLAEFMMTEINREQLHTVFLQLECLDVQFDQEAWFLDGKVTEMIDYANQQAENTFLIGLKWRPAKTQLRGQTGGRFLEEVEAVFAGNEVPEVMKTMITHPEGKKWTMDWEEAEQTAINEEARHLLDRLLRE